MALGPGKYDDLCTYVRTQAEAEGAFLIIFERGGRARFAVQGTTAEIAFALPRTLRGIADEIDRDIKAPRAVPPGALQGEWEALTEPGVDMDALIEGRRVEQSYTWYRLVIDRQMVWIEPRPSYCNRGRYHANYDGSFFIDDGDGFPRYYMDLEAAKAEMKAWLVHRIQCERRDA